MIKIESRIINCKTLGASHAGSVCVFVLPDKPGLAAAHKQPDRYVKQGLKRVGRFALPST
jgi:hypothetical protein